MIYVSFSYYLFVAALAILYYLLPLRFRWTALLAGSLGFYCWMSPGGLPVFLGTAALSYALGMCLHWLQGGGRGSHEAKSKNWAGGVCLLLGLITAFAPLLAVKWGNVSWAAPLGISFYSLQIAAYLTDIYRGRIAPLQNPLRYLLFVSFFPQIVQGPIPRLEQLGGQLFEGHRFDERTFTKGLHLIIWGFFLKFMIADKAGVVVDAVFDQFPTYQGFFILVAGVLYSIQLYADFLACVTLSRGAAGLFGVELARNFDRPYRARSIREFWRRWHISLSSWLRDYVYIPLGGNRRGRIAKFINLTVVFAVSGVWHGTGWKFLVWGLLHAFYQIAGELTAPLKKRMYILLRLPENSFARKLLQTLGTFLWVMLAWIIFRAESLESALVMIRSMFTVYNPWTLFDGSLFTLGLEGKEFFILLLSVMTLWGVETWQEKRCIRDWILEQHLIVRWGIYLAGICLIWIYGTYGFGFGQDFIYGRF